MIIIYIVGGDSGNFPLREDERKSSFGRGKVDK